MLPMALLGFYGPAGENDASNMIWEIIHQLWVIGLNKPLNNSKIWLRKHNACSTTERERE